MSAGPAAPRLMVLGIGNADRGDDGIGPWVADRLEGRLPPGTVLVKRAGDLLGLVEEWQGQDALFCIDAAAPACQPGRLHRLDLARDALPPEPSTSSHAFGLAEAIALSRALGTAPAEIIVFAIEGVCFDTGAPLGAAVEAAGRVAVEALLAELRRLLPDRMERADA